MTTHRPVMGSLRNSDNAGDSSGVFGGIGQVTIIPCGRYSSERKTPSRLAAVRGSVLFQCQARQFALHPQVISDPLQLCKFFFCVTIHFPMEFGNRLREGKGMAAVFGRETDFLFASHTLKRAFCRPFRRLVRRRMV